jgi:hypothetical protein
MSDVMQALGVLVQQLQLEVDKVTRERDAAHTELSVLQQLIKQRDDKAAQDALLLEEARNTRARLSTVEWKLAAEKRVTKEYRGVVLELLRTPLVKVNCGE